MSREQQHLYTYLDLFIHRRDLYAQQTRAGAYFLKPTPVTDDVVRAHLRGTITAGWYALTPDNTTRWVTLDADRADGLEQLQQAWKQLEARGISSQLERSRRGGHLWIPFEPIPAHMARHLVLGLLPDLEGVEVFPKRDRLDEDTRVGNPMRGPLGIHRLTGQRYPFVDPISLIPVSRTLFGTLDYLKTIERVSAMHASELLAHVVDDSGSAPPTRVRERPQAPRRSRAGPTPIEQSKEQIGDLHTFITRYVPLDASGRGHCPFHPPDVHPSFAVDGRRGFWVDFHEVNPRTGRYQGGDAIEFYRRLKGVSYPDAVRELGDLLR